MISNRLLRNTWALGVFAVILAPISSLYAQEERLLGIIDIRTMAKDADFIFKGKVDKIEFRNSESVQAKDLRTGQLVFDPNGEPIWQDGSNLPHSFVTYRIEHIYKGKAPEGQPGEPPSPDVTLRFLGGLYMDEPNMVFFVPDYPHMDLADRDVLFVQANTVRACPLVGSATGRFRIFIDPNDGIPKVYNEAGHEVLHVLGVVPALDEVALGPCHHFPEVTTYHFGDCTDCTLERSVVHTPDEFSLPGQADRPEQGVPPGPQFRETDFDAFVTQVVLETHTARELEELPPVVSADVSQPFHVEPLVQAEPNEFQPDVSAYPRPWLDELPEDEREAILEAEWIEEQLLKLTGGNPVLPSTPCEMKILLEGAIAGDISGPNNKPDCRVDFYDFVVVAGSWLECNDPNDVDCL